MVLDGFVPVSVIIPNYNSEAYLDECVRSINTGQWPLEILIIDDCSADDSLQLAKKLEAEFSNVRVVQLPENVGAAAARKVGVLQARCDWIAIVDADDYIETDAISTALAKAIQDCSDMCIWQLWRFNEKRAWCLMSSEPASFPKTARQAVVDTLGRWKIHPMGVAKKELYLAAYGQFNKKYWNADEIISRLLFSESQQISLCEKRYFYRVNPNSISNKKQIKLTGLQTAIWVVVFSKNYPEVSPSVAGSTAISCAWDVLRNRKNCDNKAAIEALSSFISQLIEFGDLKKWLWRSPKQAAKFTLIWIVCKLNK
jgi:glycosyltransferase involved in cell wall biosynthesis